MKSIDFLVKILGGLTFVMILMVSVLMMISIVFPEKYEMLDVANNSILLPIMFFLGGAATGIYFGNISEKRIKKMLTHMCTELKIKLPD